MKKKTWIFSLLLILVIVVAGVAANFYQLNDKNQSKTANETNNEEETTYSFEPEEIKDTIITIEDREDFIVETLDELRESGKTIKEKINNFYTRETVDMDEKEIEKQTKDFYNELKEMKEQVEEKMNTFKKVYDEYVNNLENYERAVDYYLMETEYAEEGENEFTKLEKDLEKYTISPDSPMIKQTEIEILYEEAEEHFNYFISKFEEFEEQNIKQAE